MAGMLAVLMTIGGIVTMVVRTSERVEQAQTRMNTQQIQDKLAQYLIDNKATDVDGDGILELPEQWQYPNAPNATAQAPALNTTNFSEQNTAALSGFLRPSASAPSGQAGSVGTVVTPDPYSPEDTPGFIPLNANVPENLLFDADGNLFRVCSYKFTLNGTINDTEPNRTHTPLARLSFDEALNQTVFAIIGTKSPNTEPEPCNILSSPVLRDSLTSQGPSEFGRADSLSERSTVQPSDETSSG